VQGAAALLGKTACHRKAPTGTESIGLVVKNGSDARATFARSMPTPVSLTEKQT
jgi:hypothetical protein